MTQRLLASPVCPGEHGNSLRRVLLEKEELRHGADVLPHSHLVHRMTHHQSYEMKMLVFKYLMPNKHCAWWTGCEVKLFNMCSSQMS